MGYLQEKEVDALRPYFPEPVPYELGELIRYLDQELNRIAETIQPLADTFNPKIVGGMSGPGYPLIIDTIPSKVVNYDDLLISESFDYAGVTFDQVNGEIHLNGNPDISVLIKIDANIIMNIGTLAANQSVKMEVGDPAYGYTTIAQGYISEVFQEAINLNGSRYVSIPGDAVIALYLTAFDSSGESDLLQGDFEIEYIDNFQQHTSYKKSKE